MNIADFLICKTPLSALERPDQVILHNFAVQQIENYKLQSAEYISNCSLGAGFRGLEKASILLEFAGEARRTSNISRYSRAFLHMSFWAAFKNASHLFAVRVRSAQAALYVFLFSS